MLDEQQLIHRIESANTDDLIAALLSPSWEEEQTFRLYFGDESYDRLRLLALRSRDRARGIKPSKGNVVVIHGILGGELSEIDRSGTQQRLWLKVPQIMQGKLALLRLSEEGRSESDSDYDVRASGILKRYYGTLLLSLAQNWTVRAFWFDWRKDVKLAADELQAKISNWFGDAAPVHLVAHSMGGLVARAFVKRHPQRWETMWDAKADGARGGRLIMVGTPNHGSFEIPQVIVGLSQIVRLCALLDLRHGIQDLLPVFHSFPGIYQMLPSPLMLKKEVEPLYDAKTYGSLSILQRHLDEAQQHHEWMSDIIDFDRMIYIAGDNQVTLSRIENFEKLNDINEYKATIHGDGTVPHQLALLRTDNRQISAYYVEEKHDRLPSHPQILSSLDELLETGETTLLSANPVSRRGARVTSSWLEHRQEAQNLDKHRLKLFIQQTQNRSIDERQFLGAEERQIEESLTRGFVAYGSGSGSQAQSRISLEPLNIELRIVHGSIDALPEQPERELLIDAIAVGHYVGVQPQAAELALDKIISQTLFDRSTGAAFSPQTPLLLTQYSERGIIRGELGQPFFLSDPRSANRVIAIAGMGLPGRFGSSELTVLARELCWSLGQLGKQHLATVLIGAGNGNLSVEDAIAAWIRGIKHGITGGLESDPRRLVRITFVEQDPRKIALIQEAIVREQARLERDRRLTIQYVPFNSDELAALENQGYEWSRREWEAQRKQIRAANQVPTRVTLSFDRKIYRFGAITETASIPEREVPLDPSLVWRANQEMAAEPDRAMQQERGQFLQRLLIPRDLRSQIFTGAPIVMILDATTARLHWEIMAHSPTRNVHAASSEDSLNSFLGIDRGFTRQLRTTFAPPPEPPPAPSRILNVLVVADPALDARLPGAEREGYEVANLFESFNEVNTRSENQVKVTRLIGSRQATRTNVLRHLMLHSFDVLHFAGHCVYCADDPAASGWIFSEGERLSVNELSRIDRVPAFVFSNACESGITPDRSGDRSDHLAPSFAESFFAQGVSNFVCTAWPVYDTIALRFALRLYAGMLGLTLIPEQTDRYTSTPIEAMYVAMREARRMIAESTPDVRTWGAYQHYGNPFFQLFSSSSSR